MKLAITAALCVAMFAIPMAHADQLQPPGNLHPQKGGQEEAVPPPAASVPQQAPSGIDALFSAKPAEAGGGQRTCHQVTVAPPESGYQPVGVLLPVEGNGPPRGATGTPTYTVEFQIPPAAARQGDYIRSVQECTFGQNGHSVWYTVRTIPTANGSDHFFGAVIPLPSQIVAGKPPVNVTLRSGTYHGHWIRAGDHWVVVLVREGEAAAR